MKSPFIISLAAIFTSATVTQAAIIHDFESQNTDDFFRSGSVSGWSQNVANPTAFDTEFPMAYISTANFGGGISNAGFLGTLRANFSPHQDTMLTGSLSTAGQMSGYALSMNFALLDNAEDPFTTRDNFSIHIADASSNTIATLLITPNLGDTDLWDLSYSVDGSGTTASGISISSNTGYLLFVSFLDESVRFSYGAASGGIATDLIAEVATTSATGAEFGNLQLVHNPLGDPGSSANALIFDNIAVVPEPTGALLFGLSALAILRRRRA